MLRSVSSACLYIVRLLSAGTCLFWLFSSGCAIAAAPVVSPLPTQKLQEIAGWDVAGLGGVALAGFDKTDNAFSGRLLLEGVPSDLIPNVIGFKQPGQSLYNLALVYSGKSLTPLLPLLKDTAIAELELSGLMVLVSPPAYAGTSVQLPTRIGQVSLPGIGGTTVKLVAGAQLVAGANALGATAALLQAVGLSPRNLSLVGTIDARMLAGAGLKNAPSQADLINAINLQIGLSALAPARKPAYLSFGKSLLLFKGVGGKIASGIATSLSVNVGSGLNFDSVTINRDPVNRTLSITSSGIRPAGNFITFPVAGAGITQVLFTGLIDEQTAAKDHFVLTGQYVVGSSTPRDFSAVLTGVSPAQYVVTVQTDMSLGQMLGWSVPGLDALVLQDVQFGNGFILGDLTIKGVGFNVFIFKGEGQQKFNAAFLHDGTATLPTLMSALGGTPLSDLELSQLGLLLAPKENSTAVTTFPEAVARHLGMPSALLKTGLNLIATGRILGETSALLNGVGVASSGLKIAGSLDTAVLAAELRAPVSQAFVDALDLRVVLPALAPTRKPAYLGFGNSELIFNGVGGKIAAGIVTSLSVNVGSGLRFAPVTIKRDPNLRQITMLGDVATPGSGSISLPIPGASVRQIGFNGLIDEKLAANDRFGLTGKYVIANAAPKDFSAELFNESPARYVVTVHTETRLADLLGWPPAPGLNELMLTDIVFGNGYALGHVTLRGVVLTVVVFKGNDRQQKSDVAFLHEGSIALPTLMSALKGTPLADFDLSKLALVLVPPENANVATKFPQPVSAQLGVSSLNLKAGLNIIAQGRAVGEVRELLERAGISLPDLTLSGTVDSSLLSGVDGAALAQAFLDALDLKIPLPDFVPPGIDKSVVVQNAMLTIKGIKLGIDTAITGELAVHLQGTAQPLKFDATLRLVKAVSGDTVAIAGRYPGALNHPFGMDWLNLRNVGIAGSIGQVSKLAITGNTDLGNVRNLDVSIDLAAKPAGGSELAVELTGADIPLSAIPVLSAIPHAADLSVRDLLVSPRAMRGTLKSGKFPLVHQVAALAFENGGRWSVAALFDDLELTRLLPPRMVPSSMGKLQLRKAALLISQSGVRVRLADLSASAQTALLPIYGSTEGMISVTDGVGLLAVIDTSPLGSALARFLPPGQNVVLQGGASGVIGAGSPSLALAASIPAVRLPAMLSFVSLPNNARTEFFIKIAESSASFGIQVDAILDVKMGKQILAFDSAVAFEFDSMGGVAIDLQGKSLNPWRNALDIKGFTLDAGTRIEVKTTASSETTLTFVGKSHIGTRELDITGSASIVGGVVDKGAFEGKVSELAMADLLALFDAAVQAGGGQPVKVDFPEAVLKNVDVAFASPGVNVAEMNLPNGGSRLAGELWFLLKGQALGKFKSQVSETSLVMNGALSDFTLGPVAMKGNTLDVQAQTAPLPLPHFTIRGGATILGKHVDGEYALGFTESEVAANLDLGDLLKVDMHASFPTPAAGLDPGALAAQDMAINAALKSDIGAWLRGAGKAAVALAFKSVTQGLDDMVRDIKAAQGKVNTLNDSLDKARKRALAGAKTLDQQVAQAEKKVNDLAAQVKDLDNDIKSAKNNIHGCNYTRNICYWWNWKGHCTKHKDVPDPGRDVECEADNVRYAGVIAADSAAQKSAEEAKTVAEGVLAALHKGEQGVDLASLDPEVIAIEASLVVANQVLDAAKDVAKGAELGIGQLNAGVAALSRADIFRLTGSSLQGSLQKSVAGKPVVLGLDFEVAGKPQHIRLTVSLTDPAYTAKRFEPLALLVAKMAIEAMPEAAPAVVHLLNQAYKPLHDAAELEVDKAIKDNGLGE